MLITVIGRGHSGTRAISQTLSESGVYMGSALNESGDLLPPEPMYEACRVIARHVRYLGNMQWDFSALHSMPIEAEFEDLVHQYLESVLARDAQEKGWKLPETILAHPWIARMFPDVHYIHWVRDPRDNILGQHITDDLALFGVPCDHTDNEQMQRATSWKYQAAIYRTTPRPKHLLEVRFEDFVLDQRRTLRRIEDFLGISLVAIPVRTESVGRWRQADPQEYTFDFLTEEITRYGYAVPAKQTR